MNSKKKKILFVCTEDWFFHSHFLPLIEAACKIEKAEICLATTAVDKYRDIERLGVRIIPVEFDRSSLNILSAAKLLFRLIALFHREKPDLVHLVALKPIVLGGLAAQMRLSMAKIYHLTGQGFFTLAATRTHEGMRNLFMKLTAFYLRRPRSWLLIENPDDIAALQKYGRIPEANLAILGGAGVDPDHFSSGPAQQNDPLRLAFVGRMVWSKGVDVLIEALDLLQAEGTVVQLDLYGEPDTDNPRSLTKEQLEIWSEREDVNWHGRSEDIVKVWRKADMAIVPSRGGEGLPRSLLEAASCAKPVIVTDVPGCRHFVRDGVEGLVVPPEDTQALAEAISKLANDFDLRAKMGKAARQRVLNGYTERHVIDDVATVYEKLLKR